MKHSTIPWFVYNNRDKGQVKVDIVRERRAIVLTVCYGVIFLCLTILACAYCRKIFLIILTLNAIIGFFAFMRTVFRFSRGDKL